MQSRVASFAAAGEMRCPCIAWKPFPTSQPTARGPGIPSSLALVRRGAASACRCMNISIQSTNQQHSRVQGASSTPRAAARMRMPRCRAAANHRHGVGHITQYSSAAAVEARPELHYAAATLTSQLLEGFPATYFKELYIKDFARVSEARLRLAPGLTVITGESGSGKSVLVECLGQLLGGTPPPECVRGGAEVAVIEGVVSLAGGQLQEQVVQLLQSQGVPPKAYPKPQEGSDAGLGLSSILGGQALLHIRREIWAAPSTSTTSTTSNSSSSLVGSRSKVYLNGVPTSLRVLRCLGGLLLDANGQHSALQIKDGEQQLKILDKIAGVTSLAGEVSSCLGELRRVEQQLSALSALGDDTERSRLERLVALVEKAAITPGEERSLRLRLSGIEARRAALATAGHARMGIAGDGTGQARGLLEGLSIVERHVQSLLQTEEEQLLLMMRQKDMEEERAEGSSSTSATAETRSGSTSRERAGSSEGAAEVRDNEEQEEEDEDEEEDEEVASTAAGIKALEGALFLLQEARDALRGVEGKVEAYAGLHEGAEAEAAALTGRLDVLTKLMRAQRVTNTEELLRVVEGHAARLEGWYAAEGKREVWESEAAALRSRARDVALLLSKRRREAAGQLRLAVEATLRQLAMGDSRFDARLVWEPTPSNPPSRASRSSSSSPTSLEVPEEAARKLGQLPGTFLLNPSGLDRVEFLLAAGPADPLLPLAAVASGGESARLMLALKAAPAVALKSSTQGLEGLGGRGLEGWEQGYSGGAYWGMDAALGGGAHSLKANEPLTRELLAQQGLEMTRIASSNGTSDGGSSNCGSSCSDGSSSSSSWSCQSSAAADAGLDGHGDSNSSSKLTAEFATTSAGTEPAANSTAGATPIPSCSSSSTSSGSSSSSHGGSDQGSDTSSLSAATAAGTTDTGTTAAAAGTPPPPSSSASAGAAVGPPVLILDELDSGVGSRLGSSMGQLLRAMSSPPGPAAHQVLCVTHLPQVAAHALHHIKVTKTTSPEGNATTSFKELMDPSERLAEVAEMMGVELAVAQQLIQQAQHGGIGSGLM